MKERRGRSLQVIWLALLFSPAFASAEEVLANLGDHVRAGRWEAVRAACSKLPSPWPPEVTLVAARAERHLGQLEKADRLLREALPGAGALAPLLRLEAGEVALTRGRDPWRAVQPLLAARPGAAQRRAVSALLRRAWEILPPGTLAAYQERPLPSPLQRWRDAITAARTSQPALALRVLAEKHDDGPAAEAAGFLTRHDELTLPQRLLVGRALLATGSWREAGAWLASLPQPSTTPERWELAFLLGRAHYRLGRLAEAASTFSVALAHATTAGERHTAAVQRARCAELLGDWEAAHAAWTVARTADPTAPAGWEGVGRALILLGQAAGVCEPLAASPPSARTPAAERLAAVLLARSLGEEARRCLTFVPADSPRGRLLRAVERRLAGEEKAARHEIIALLADPRAGSWREVALLLPWPLQAETAPVTPSRHPRVLAELLTHRGVEMARAAAAAALAEDPRWGFLAQEQLAPPTELPPELDALLAMGLEADAAQLLPVSFPTGAPAAAAWSAAVLARGGNGPAALRTGEAIWEAVGALPAGLLPTAVGRVVLPPPLLAPIVTAAKQAGVSPALLAGIVRQESRFDAAALSPAGARGMAQLMPETARRLGASEDDIWNPEQALNLAAREVARLTGVFGDRPAVVAAAYNAGEGVVASWLAALGTACDDVTFIAAIPYQETSHYVRAVLAGRELARYLEE